ncbi:MAG: hypothetical protein NC200_02680 [Candidatus Gastranaerophilales bacterium]|nr:hypothetical protein [Candidatus Gastranaerophilales bacterium]
MTREKIIELLNQDVINYNTENSTNDNYNVYDSINTFNEKIEEIHEKLFNLSTQLDSFNLKNDEEKTESDNVVTNDISFT